MGKETYELRVADGQVALEGQHDVGVDGAAENDVMHGVEQVDEELRQGGERDFVRINRPLREE